MNDQPAAYCVTCPRGLYADELGRSICRPCEQRIDADLLALAGPGGLYARLCLRIHPGRGGDGPSVAGTRTAPVPVRLDVLSLTANGGIVSTLETWVEDWAAHGLAHVGAGGGLQHRVDQAITTLRLNLTRAAATHPALDEFAREIWQLRRRCETGINGEPRPRRIPVQCDCGTVLRVTLDTPGRQCAGCGTQYGHEDLFSLPLAERHAA